jgi:diguanylate cyclase (GGDEF)-like protein
MSSELDTLTGLPNRRAFDQRFAAEFEAGGPVVTMLLDIKDFKGTNNLYGHAAGDQVLATVARRLEEVTYAGDFVARLGGDEFIVLVNSVRGDEDDPAALEREVEDAISSEPIQIGGGPVHVGVTIKTGLLNHPDDLVFLDWS